MSGAATTILALGAITYLLKAAGPLVVAGRSLPPLVERVSSLMPGPLLGALVLTSTLVGGAVFVLDARLAGLAAAAVALRLRAGFVTVVVVAAAVTALIRAV